MAHDREADESRSDEDVRNGRRIVGALTLTKSGDAVVDAKAVLPFLLAAGGAPAVLTGLLVPIRESGSMLPQAALAPYVQRVERRRLVWAAGSVGQAIAVVGMAVAALSLSGAALGGTVVVALAFFALSRSLSSIAFKDVLGRAVSQGSRGRVTGLATSAAGIVALTIGVAIRLLGGGDGGGQGTSTDVFGVLLFGAAIAWLLAAAIFTTVRERPEEDAADPAEVDRSVMDLLRDDGRFRQFVFARTLLLASALSPPYVVALAVEETGSSLGELGPFVIASGVAALIGGRFWGDRADESSRRVMAQAAGLAALLITAFLLLRLVEDLRTSLLLYVAVHFLLNVVHAGARVGRSTYIVDVASGDLRTRYVAASNTVMAVALLGVGAAVGLVADVSTIAALVLLVGVGVAGVPASRSLPTTVESGA